MAREWWEGPCLPTAGVSLVDQVMERARTVLDHNILALRFTIGLVSKLFSAILPFDPKQDGFTTLLTVSRAWIERINDSLMTNMRLGILYQLTTHPMKIFPHHNSDHCTRQRLTTCKPAYPYLS